METGTHAKILRIYVSSTDKIRHTAAYEAIVYMARQEGLAGATVCKGFMGYGASHQLYSEKFWELSEKVPVVIEIVDESSKISQFLDKIRPMLEQMPKGCLVTGQDTEIILCKKGITH